MAQTLVSFGGAPHIIAMETNYSVFPERLAEACRARNMTRDKLCASIGMGSRRATDFLIGGLKAVDLYRLCQMADRLDVSIDWLLGRSNVMSVMEMPEESEPPKRKTKR
jgi:transcriptional regulator with XRE-family HTH domain